MVRVMRWLLGLFVFSPLRRLYIDAPPWMGGWSGKAEHEICALMTGMKAQYWETRSHDCSKHIDEKLDQIVNVVMLCGYFVSLIWILRWMIYKIPHAAAQHIVARRQPQFPGPHSHHLVTISPDKRTQLMLEAAAAFHIMNGTHNERMGQYHSHEEMENFVDPLKLKQPRWDKGTLLMSGQHHRATSFSSQ
jgi:hypothetical protein